MTALTGAGISAESGVPTFRGEEGLWKKFRPEELASFDAFIQNPDLVWEWYNFRRSLILDVDPNPGHVALAAMERQFDAFWLVTQNVDGLHARAGSCNILELHGNILRSRCLECRTVTDNVTLDGSGRKTLPKCRCGGLLRPDVVWYGEMVPEKTLEQAIRVTENCDLFFSIGTSALVQPAASLPLMAKRSGAYVVEINTDRTVISGDVDEVLIGPSGTVLPALIDARER